MDLDIGLLISYAIKIIPTAMYVFGIIFGMVSGFIRGYRKSLIFLIHTLIVGFVCFAGYFAVVSITGLDEKLFNLVDLVLGLFNGSIHNLLNVSENCTSFNAVVIEIVTNALGVNNIISSLIVDNGAYIATLIDFVYHLLFAILFYILFIILIICVRMTYHLFYSNKKIIRKNKKQYLYGKEYELYRKKRRWGLCIGGFKHAITGLIGLSFLGSLLFILSGAEADKKYEEVDFNNDTVNTIYDVYTALGSYGDTGIYKFLNSFKDKNDIPYYLFASDIIFQGGLKDDNFNFDGNIIFRDELATYVGFARDTFDLLLKYDTNGDIKALLGQNGTKDPLQIMMELSSNKDFYNEFNQLIEDFEGKTYFVNLTFSLINSVVSNIDKLNLNLPPVAMDIFNIFFIEDGCIKVTDIIDRQDIKIIFKTLVTILCNQPEEGLEQKEQVLHYVDLVLPELRKLSLFNDQQTMDKMNVVLTKTYDYVLENVLSENTSLMNAKMLAREANFEIDEIDWYAEISNLLTLALEGIDVYFEFIEPAFSEGNVNIAQFILKDFLNNDDPQINIRNEAVLDNLITVVSNSKIISRLLCSDVIYKPIDNFFVNTLNVSVPKELLNFHNQYDKNGVLKEYGEFYYLLNSIKVIAKSDDCLELYDKFFASGDSSFDQIEDIKMLTSILSMKVNNSSDDTIIEHLLSSNLLRCALSGFLTGDTVTNLLGMELYLPNSVMTSIITNGKEYKFVSKNELVNTINLLPTIIDKVLPLLNVEEGKEPPINDLINIILSDDIVNTLEKNVILQGALSGVLINFLKNQDMIVITEGLSEIEPWVTTSNKKGELINILNSIKYSNINIDELMNGGFTLDQAKEWNLEVILNSKLLHYTVSNLLFNLGDLGDFKVIIPEHALDKDIVDVDLKGNSIKAIKKSELQQIISVATGLLSENELDPVKLFKEKDKILESDILVATLICNLVEMLEGTITVPEVYKLSANPEALEKSDNIWFTTNELPNIMGAIEVLFDIDSEDFDFNKLEEIDFSIITDLKNDVKKVEVVTGSNIINYTLVELIVGLELINKDSVETIKKNGLYPKQELTGLVNGLLDLGIELDESNTPNFDFTNLTKSKEKQSEVVNNKTKFDVITSSKITLLIMTSLLDTVLVGESNTGLLTKVEADSIKVNGMYNKQELGSLIDVLDLLNIEDLNNFEADNLLETIFDSTDKANTANIITSSNLVLLLIGKNLDTVLLNSNLLDEKKISNLKVDGSYPLKDVKGLINGLLDLDIKLNDENPVDFKALTNSKNENSTIIKNQTKFDVITSSKITLSIMSSLIDAAIVSEDNKGLLTQKEADSIKVNEMYTKNELGNLLDVLELLGIDDINNFKADNLLNIIFDSNDKANTANVITSSNLVVMLIGKNLDTVLLDSNLLDEQKVSNLKVDGSYPLKDVKGLINGLLDLEIKFNDDNKVEFDFEKLTNSKNTDSIVVEGQTKFDVITSSKITLSIMSSIIDDAIVSEDSNSTLLTQKEADSVKVNGIYTKKELGYLIDVLEELEIKDLNNFESEKLIDNIFNSNDPSNTANVITSSSLVVMLIGKNLDNTLIDAKLLSNEDIKLLKVDGSYPINDVKGLINGLLDLDINLDDTTFDFSIITDSKNTDSIVVEGQTKFDVITSSKITLMIMTNKIDDAIVNDDDTTKLSIKEANSIKSNGIYTKKELGSLIDVLVELDIKDINDFKSDDLMDNIFDSEDQSKTANVITSSNLVVLLIGKNLDTVLIDANLLNKDELNSLKTNGSYKTEDIKGLINGLLDLDIKLDDAKVDFSIIINSKNTDSSVIKGQTKFDVITSSRITLLIMTKKIDEAIVNDDDTTKLSTKEANSIKENGMYTVSEFSRLIDVLVELDIKDINDFKSDDIIDNIFESEDQSKTADIMTSSNLVVMLIGKNLDKTLLDAELLSNEDIKLLKVDGSYPIKDIKGLINGLLDLDINLDDAKFDLSIIINSKKTNSDVIKGQTKFDVITSSRITLMIMSNKIDDAIVDDNDSSKLSTKEANSIKVKGMYTTSEISGLIDSLNEFGITDFENIQIENAFDKVLSANEASDVVDGQTKLDVYTSSEIILIFISKKLEDSLVPTYISASQSESIKVNGKYPKKELEGLVYGLDELEITDLDGIDGDQIASKITDLNKQSDNVEGKTKLQVITSSQIMTILISKELDKVLIEGNPQILTKSEADSVKVKGLYTTSELENLINALIELGVDNINNIDVSDVAKDISSFNNYSEKFPERTRLDVLTSSKIVLILIRNELDKQIVDNNDPNKLTVEEANSIKVNGIYTKKELTNLVNGLAELDIKDFNEIDGNEIASKILTFNKPSDKVDGKTKLEVITSSKITSIMISRKLDDVLTKEGSNLLTQKEADSIKVNGIYTTDELEALINALIELDIDNLNNIDVSDVADNILSFNEPSKEFNGQTRLDVITSSKIMLTLISKKLDEQIVDDKDLNKLTQKEADSIKVKGIYTKEELKNLVDGLVELDIKDLDKIKDKDIASEILDFNQPSNKVDGKTRLEVINSSKIMSILISKKLDEQIVNDTDSNKLTQKEADSIKVKGMYTTDELESLINALKELSIEDINNINVSNAADNILSFNDESKVFKGHTRLYVITSSKIISILMSKKLDAILTNKDSNLLTQKEADSIKVKGMYTTEELENLIYAFEELGISNINNIDADTLVDNVLNLNSTSTKFSDRTRLQVVMSSKIAAIIMSNKIDEVLIKEELVDSDVLDAIKTKNTYSEEEVSNLINSFEILGIDDINNVNADNFNDIQKLRDNLSELYKSRVVACLITKQLDSILIDAGIRKQTINKCKVRENTIYCEYKLEELELLLDGLDVCGISDMDSMNTLNVRTLNEEYNSTGRTKLEIMYDSLILRDLITQKLDEIIEDSDYLATTTEAKDELGLYKLEEIEAILDIVNNNLDEFDIDSLTIANLKENANKSNIFRATLSRAITNKFSVPKNVIKNNTITIEELNNFLDGIEAFGVTRLNEKPNIKIPEDNKLNIVLNSMILRTMITEEIGKINDGLYVQVKDDYVIFTQDDEGNNILVLTSTEIKAVINAINILTGDSKFKVNISLESLMMLSVDNRDKLLDSNILNITVTKLIKPLYTLNPFKPAIPSVKAYDLEGLDKKDVELLEKNQILAFINSYSF